MTYIGGINEYEKQCRAVMDGWKGFEVIAAGAPKHQSQELKTENSKAKAAVGSEFGENGFANLEKLPVLQVEV